MTTSRSSWTRVSGVAYVLVGLALAIGGVWLLGRGGSWYYLVGGLAVAATGVLLWQARRAALWLYALFLIGTLVWAVAEVGFDWWQLLPRLDLWFLMGAWLLLPALNCRLIVGDRDVADASRFRRPGIASAVLWAALGLTLAGGLLALTRDRHSLDGTYTNHPTDP
jgi:quinoprotein glucose dehydrogenase